MASTLPFRTQQAMASKEQEIDAFNSAFKRAGIAPKNSIDNAARIGIQAVNELNRRGIINARVKRKDASGFGRHTNMTLLDGIK